MAVKHLLIYCLACMHLIGVEQQDPYLILSIDGGGIRGVIPARILSLLEDFLSVKSAEVFDCFAGTSTGGIIAIGLTIPDPDEPTKPRYGAKDLEQIYVENGAEIFNNGWYHWLLTLGGLIGPKYDNGPFEQLLKIKLGNITLDKVVKDLFITSFDITTHKQFLFENINHEILHNSPLVDIALSTSAAPTYFPSHELFNQNLVDGGLLANNPAAWAYFEAIKSAKIQENRDVYVLSLGTGIVIKQPIASTESGLIASIEPIISELFDSSDDSVEEAFNALEKSNRVHYIRWDPTLYKSSQIDLDNIDSENITELLELAEAYFQNQFTTTKFAPLKAILQHRAEFDKDRH